MEKSMLMRIHNYVTPQFVVFERATTPGLSFAVIKFYPLWARILLVNRA